MYICTLDVHLYIEVVGVSDESRERLVAEIPTELKELCETDRRSIREIVEAALWREFGGERKAALERRIEEKRRRISMIESERNERNRELEELRDELTALETKQENTTTVAEEVIAEALETFTAQEIRRMEPDHAPAEHWAGKADLDPETFVDRFKTAHAEAEDA